MEKGEALSQVFNCTHKLSYADEKTDRYLNGTYLFTGFHGGHRVHENGTSKTTKPNNHVQQERGNMPKRRAAVSYVPRW